PDAILTLKNSATVAVFETLQKHGVKVPETLALVGYDDFEMAAVLRPSISVIRQPIEAIGHAAAELLFERLLSPGTARRSVPQQVVLETQLVVRRSCGCCDA
ncbi:substrate-binding domain-containing protein, partial [Granulicella paludicola]|uniref:substrate-binding domain-containing protein n=1 Tax=Granulicella paludicola TaxID=474951 RepID=UPI0021E0AF57